MVRKFDTEVQNFYSLTDFERIAKEMVNIYHGIKYYNTDIINAPLLKKPINNYLSFEESGVISTITPARGYIYINCDQDLWELNIKFNELKNILKQNFNKFNLWNNRKFKAVFQNSKALQYTYELHKIEDNENIIEIFESNDPFNSKMYKESMVWFYSNKKELFKYTIPGETRKPYQIMAAASTIILDLSHNINLPDNSFTLSMPSLPKDKIFILKNNIYISKRAGIDVHLYSKMNPKIGLFRKLNKLISCEQEINSDDSVIQKSVKKLIKETIKETDKKIVKKIVKKIDKKIVKEDINKSLIYAACSVDDNILDRNNIWEVDASQTEVPKVCLICNCELWEQNYLLIAKQQLNYKVMTVIKRGRGAGDKNKANKDDNESDLEDEEPVEKPIKKLAKDAKKIVKKDKKVYDRPNAAVLCRFCVHYDHNKYNINNDDNISSINIINNHINRDMIINKYIIDENEKIIISRIFKNIKNEKLIFHDKTPELKNDQMCHLSGDSGLLFGVPQYVDLGDCANHLLNYALNMENKVMTFKYIKCE